MKIMNLDEIAQNETEILKQLDHENIVKYFDHFELDTRSNANNRQIKLCIVTEFCQVEMFFFIFRHLFRSLKVILFVI